MLVVHSSVIVKWLVQDADNGEHTEAATRLMERVALGHETVLQPAHWLYDVGRMLTRLSPQSAAQDLSQLQDLELPTAQSPSVLSRACALSIDARCDLLSTLYHAVALETPNATLVTADEGYWLAAGKAGCIITLREWSTGAA